MTREAAVAQSELADLRERNLRSMRNHTHEEGFAAASLSCAVAQNTPLDLQLASCQFDLYVMPNGKTSKRIAKKSCASDYAGTKSRWRDNTNNLFSRVTNKTGRKEIDDENTQRNASPQNPRCIN